MKMLHMSATRRARLLSENLLAVTSRDHEVLHGLSFDESQFLIDHGGAQPGDGAARARCDELMCRHERARLRIATADDESSASGAAPLRSARY
jgi:hypothetical protein